MTSVSDNTANAPARQITAQHQYAICGRRAAYEQLPLKWLGSIWFNADSEGQAKLLTDGL